MIIIVDMDKSIKQIEQELLLLEQKKNEMENVLADAISSAMLKVAQKKPMRRISQHCFVIRLSDMIGNPWNSEFYDWEKSIAIILKFLKPKPAREWSSALNAKLESTSKNQPVVFEYHKRSFGVMSSEKIPVSRIFIEQIIKELNQ